MTNQSLTDLFVDTLLLLPLTINTRQEKFFAKPEIHSYKTWTKTTQTSSYTCIIVSKPIKMACSPIAKYTFGKQAKIISICRSLAEFGTPRNQYLPEFFHRLQRQIGTQSLRHEYLITDGRYRILRQLIKVSSAFFLLCCGGYCLCQSELPDNRMWILKRLDGSIQHLLLFQNQSRDSVYTRLVCLIRHGRSSSGYQQYNNVSLQACLLLFF